MSQRENIGVNIMSDEKHAFSIELKSRNNVISASMDCDRREGGVFIEGYLGGLLYVKVVEETLLVISGTNGTFRLDISLEELAGALSKKRKDKES